MPDVKKINMFWGKETKTNLRVTIIERGKSQKKSDKR